MSTLHSLKSFHVYLTVVVFWQAGELRDEEMELKAQITAIIDKSKEMVKGISPDETMTKRQNCKNI